MKKKLHLRRELWQSDEEKAEMLRYHKRVPVGDTLLDRTNNCDAVPALVEDAREGGTACALWRNCTLTGTKTVDGTFEPYKNVDIGNYVPVYSRIISLEKLGGRMNSTIAWEACRLDFRNDFEKCLDDVQCNSYFISACAGLGILIFGCIAVCQAFGICCFKKRKFNEKKYNKRREIEVDRWSNIESWRMELQQIANGIDPVLITLVSDGKWHRRPGDPPKCLEKNVDESNSNSNSMAQEDDDDNNESSSGDEEEGKKFKRGKKVEANYQKDGIYYPGKVVKVHGGGFYDILYTDGDLEKGVSFRDIRKRGETRKLKKLEEIATRDEAAQFESAEALKERLQNRVKVLKTLPIRDGKLCVRIDLDVKPWEYHRDYYDGGYVVRDLTDCFKCFPRFDKEIDDAFHGRIHDFDKAAKDDPDKKNKRYRKFDYSKSFVVSLKTSTDFSAITKVKTDKFVELKKDEEAEAAKKIIRKRERAEAKALRALEREERRKERAKARKRGEVVEDSDDEMIVEGFEEELPSTIAKRKKEVALAAARKAAEEAENDKFNQRGGKEAARKAALKLAEAEDSSDSEEERKMLKSIRPKEIRSKDFDVGGGRGELLSAMLVKEHFYVHPGMEADKETGQFKGDLLYEVIFCATPEKYRGLGFASELHRMFQRFVYARGGRAILMCPPPFAMGWVATLPSMYFNVAHTMPLEIRQKYLAKEYKGSGGWRSHRAECGIGKPPKDKTDLRAMEAYKKKRPTRSQVARLTHAVKRQKCDAPYYMRAGRRAVKWKKSGQPMEGYSGISFSNRPSSKAPYSNYYKLNLFFSGKPFRFSPKESSHVWWMIPRWEEIEEEFQYYEDLEKEKERVENQEKFEAAMKLRAEREEELRAKKLNRAGLQKGQEKAGDGDAVPNGGSAASPNKLSKRKGNKVHPTVARATLLKRKKMKEEMKKAAKLKKAMKTREIALRLQRRQKEAAAKQSEYERKEKGRKSNKKYQKEKSDGLTREERLAERKAARKAERMKSKMSQGANKDKEAYRAEIAKTLEKTDVSRQKDKTFKWKNRSR
eukprot:g2026.t1